MKTKNLTSYKCPACKKTSERVLQAQQGTLWYSCNLKNKEWESEEHDGQEIIGYFCENCGNELPEKLTAEIDAILNG